MEESTRSKRDVILSHARTLLEERGWDGLTMRELARRSKMSAAALYKVFEGKESILAAELTSERHAVHHHLRPQTGAHFAARMLRFFAAMFAQVEAKPDFYRQLMRTYATLEPTDEQRTVEAQCMQALTETLRSGQAAGEMVEWVDAVTLSRALFVSHCGYMVNWVQNRMTIEHARAQVLYTCCLHLAGVTRPDISAELLKIAEQIPIEMARAATRSEPMSAAG